MTLIFRVDSWKIVLKCTQQVTGRGKAKGRGRQGRKGDWKLLFVRNGKNRKRPSSLTSSEKENCAFAEYPPTISFLIIFQTPPKVCSSELWSNLVVRLAHSANSYWLGTGCWMILCLFPVRQTPLFLTLWTNPWTLFFCFHRNSLQRSSPRCSSLDCEIPCSAGSFSEPVLTTHLHAYCLRISSKNEKFSGRTCSKDFFLSLCAKIRSSLTCK